MPRRLIITADDYGMTEGVNRGIEACVQAGPIKSVCVMANMPHWREIGAMARAHPEVSIGIHWTVTQGRPVLPASEVPSLLDANGEFLRPPLFRRRLHQGGIVVDQLKAELAAQLARLREVVPGVAYWNTHQNIHVTFGLYFVFAKIARDLGVVAMRSHRRILAAEGRSNLAYYLRHPLFWLKGLVLSRWAWKAAREGSALPDGRLVDMNHPPGDVRFLRALKDTDWSGVTELVTHPADRLDGLELLTTMLQTRVDEFSLFSAQETSARLRELGVELVTFASVARRTG